MPIFSFDTLMNEFARGKEGFAEDLFYYYEITNRW